MNYNEKPEYDFDRMTGNLTILTRATRKEKIDSKAADVVAFETPGQLTFHKELNASLVNVDHYLQPLSDLLWGYPTKVEQDGLVYTTSYSDSEMVLDLGTLELQRAARCRAFEDKTDSVNVLADWTWRAANADHVAPHDAMQFLRALDDELTVTRRRDAGVPGWAIARDGTKDHWRRDERPIQTLEEARTFIRDGWDGVMARRKDYGMEDN